MRCGHLSCTANEQNSAEVGTNNSKEPYSMLQRFSVHMRQSNAILERSNVSSFPLGGKAPDQFFHALGRVSFEAESVSAHLDLLSKCSLRLKI